MRILHVFRSPVGGLFRHVRDLACGQSQLGHEVGILCDSSTGGPAAERLLNQAAPYCTLGITRTSISKLPGLGDMKGAAAVRAAVGRTGATVVHGHGAKGGVYARVAGRLAGIPSVYTPHGGSLHYEWSTVAGKLFLGSEAVLARVGSGFCFVCAFEQNLFAEKVGLAGKPSRVTLNGLWPEEFAEVPLAPEATDFLFVGEMRRLKGVDILLEALALLPRATLTLVGDGPEEQDFRALAAKLGISRRVRFAGRKPIHEALALGRVMVMPSRSESFPYVVLETSAAGRPLLASAVGGIPEVVPDELLVRSQEPRAWAEAMHRTTQNSLARFNSTLRLVQAVRERCDAMEMARQVTEFYTQLR